MKHFLTFLLILFVYALVVTLIALNTIYLGESSVALEIVYFVLFHAIFFFSVYLFYKNKPNKFKIIAAFSVVLSLMPFDKKIDVSLSLISKPEENLSGLFNGFPLVLAVPLDLLFFPCLFFVCLSFFYLINK